MDGVLISVPKDIIHSEVFIYKSRSAFKEYLAFFVPPLKYMNCQN